MRINTHVNNGHPFAMSLAFIFCGLIGVCFGSRLVYGQPTTSPQGVIQGKVLDLNGDRIEGAKVMLKQMPYGSVITAQTRNDGLFVFVGLSEGYYRVSVNKVRFVEVSSEIRLSKNGEIVELTFTLAPDTVRASMTIYSGLPIDGLEYQLNGLARMSDIQGMAVYSGKKNEILVVGDLNANLALGNTRQVFAKVPGTNIWENDGSGLQIGISNRGLDPNRSWEVNSRQNGYDITADIFGYP
jgi:Fe(3+) dicitrate transport protein